MSRPYTIESTPAGHVVRLDGVVLGVARRTRSRSWVATVGDTGTTTSAQTLGAVAERLVRLHTGGGY